MQQPFSGIQGIGKGVEGMAGGTPVMPGLSVPTFAAPSKAEADSFGSVLAQSMNKVNATIDESIKSTDGLLSGDMDSLHQMTIAGAKAEIMMKLTTSVVSKMAQATTQLFQMQI